jgi:hypothetical protein
MADRLLELLQQQEARLVGSPKPRYLEAMVATRGTVADVLLMRQLDPVSSVFQTYNVAVDGTTLIPRTVYSGAPGYSDALERYVFIDYLEEDYLDPQF